MGTFSFTSQGSPTHGSRCRSASFGDRSISHCMALFLPLPCPQGPEGWSPSPALVPPHSPGQGSPGTLISLVLPSDPGFSQRVHICCFLSRTFSHRIFGCMALSVPLFSCKLVKLSPLGRLASHHRVALSVHCPVPLPDTPWAAAGCSPFPL